MWSHDRYTTSITLYCSQVRVLCCNGVYPFGAPRIHMYSTVSYTYTSPRRPIVFIRTVQYSIVHLHFTPSAKCIHMYSTVSYTYTLFRRPNVWGLGVIYLTNPNFLLVCFFPIVISQAIIRYIAQYMCCLKKNQNAPRRPSERPPVRGKKCQNV